MLIYSTVVLALLCYVMLCFFFFFMLTFFLVLKSDFRFYLRPLDSPDLVCYVKTTQTIWPPKSACAVQWYSMV